MTAVEKIGKTVEEAVALALAELGVTENKVDIEVLEAPSKGLFGFIGTKPAKVKVTLKKIDPVAVAQEFLQNIFTAMHIEVAIEKVTVDEGVVFNLRGQDLGILIGKHGQTLDALQYLTNLAANRDIEDDRVKIIVDVEDYRKRREETLYRLAERLADKVKRRGERVVLEPMSRHERKIIHMALQDDHRISTYSEGEEPYRKVVIALKR
ncbi:protein jag|uniref:RNA-binding protein KhpB n=1 Tax=Dendrosporobacter quercicolus TaxID=146817 RepID=A0A1G9XV36_9FIRM|nr:RNA-binding cell elongation regulator Jag/EloR [Dendrosporobacter quercicolus]NSL49072.1 protein jag [Dendrosporobacter quercicolus DSM 1736]SDN00699.1 spoIIIJ-associated protein [Dendrosporobacter quercicolus]